MYLNVSNNIIGIGFGVISLISIVTTLFPIILIIIVFVKTIKVVTSSIQRAQNIRYFANTIIEHAPESKYKDVSKSILENYHIDDIGSFKNTLFELFEQFEKAYNSLDYNTMKQITTSQLYENYYTGISLNIKDGKKKVIDDIVRKKVVVFDMESTPTKQIIQTLITISYISYTIDKNGYIISGSKDMKITENFEVTFKKEYTENNIQKCPNCGAMVSGKRCDYCRTTIKDTEFKISSIKKVKNL